MAKRTLYLETSFWKRLGDQANPEMRKITYRFLRAVSSKHRLLISKLVRREIDGTPDAEERKLIFRRMAGVRLKTIPATARILRLRDEILKAGGWGNNRIADMLHVAYTVIAGADALVTWDRQDLARDHTRRVVQAVCRRRGQRAPRIGVPEEVAEWLGIRIT